MASKHYPGRDVPLNFNGTDIKVSVYPVGIKEFKKFTKAITTAASNLSQLGASIPKTVTRNEDGTTSVSLASDAWLTLGPLVADIVVNDLLDLVEECVTMPADYKFDDLRHWHLPDIVHAWILENFDSPEKINPWIQAVASLYQKLTGETLDTLNLTSTLSSLRDGLSTKSSTATNSDTTGDPSLILDGASSSSGTPSDQPST